ncbi:hypothetical protein BpHYR1_053293 [Brachionus plicatilis]|uniref:Uncharacterized protein n=1 Tax=Brachionus plicatilis TaxID=10195 RepID=A0A3M7RIH7_BRAPC|nr:hypothetical protein BpHYR1_053293 [Brachionus plicatilis]
MKFEMQFAEILHIIIIIDFDISLLIIIINYGKQALRYIKIINNIINQNLIKIILRNKYYFDYLTNSFESGFFLLHN